MAFTWEQFHNEYLSYCSVKWVWKLCEKKNNTASSPRGLRINWIYQLSLLLMVFPGTFGELFMIFLIWCHMIFLLWWDTEDHSICICQYLLMIFSIILSKRPIPLTIFFTNKSNSMKNQFYCNAISGSHTATICCTWHDSIAVMSYAKYCSINSLDLNLYGKMIGKTVPWDPYQIILPHWRGPHISWPN